MRKLMLFAIGFTAACAVGAYLLRGSWLLVAAAVALLGVVCAAIKKKDMARKIMVVALGVLIGFLWVFAYDMAYLRVAREYDGQEIPAEITVTDYSYSTEYGSAADGRVELEGRSFRIRFYSHQEAALSPGDRLEGTLQLRYTAAGGADEVTYHQGKGIFLLGYFDDDAVVTIGNARGLRYFPAVLRQQIKDLMRSVFPEDVLGFAQALLLGDSSLLSYGDSADLAVSGIRHVIAVSGLHVAILYAMMISTIGYRRVLTPVLGFALLTAFAALAGFTPSVVRACVMQGLILLSQTIRKEYDPATALGAAVLIMLAVNPMTVTSVSFQLSVGCMIGIIAFSEKIRAFFMDAKRLGPAKGKSLKARLTRWFVSSISISLSAMVTTVPLSAWYFGTVSLIGIITNLATLWVVTGLFCMVLAACVAGALWLPLGKVIAWAGSWLARYVLLVSRILSSFPLAAVYTQSIYIVIWLILCYVLICLFLLLKKKKPMVLAGCILVSLLVAVGFSWGEPRLDNYRMTVFDVGQGQCIWLQFRGRNYLVDCGGDYNRDTADIAARQLLSQGVFSLDGFILTHYDGDHAGAADMLLSRIPAKKLYLPELESGADVKAVLMENYADSIYLLDTEEILTIEDGVITIIAGKEDSSEKERGLCILFQPENCDILITGDRGVAGERALLRQIAIPDLEVLVVGHHGAKTSTSLELLKQGAPELAIISVGEVNAYGHPTQETLNRLELFGCKILRTDEIGNIIIRG